MGEGRAKTGKKITIRLTEQEFRTVRDAAYSRGLDMGPMLADLLRPLLPRLDERPKPCSD